MGSASPPWKVCRFLRISSRKLDLPKHRFERDCRNRKRVERLLDPFQLEHHWQGFQAAENWMLLPFQSIYRWAHVGETMKQGLKDNFGFESNEGGTDTKMDQIGRAHV